VGRRFARLVPLLLPCPLHACSAFPPARGEAAAYVALQSVTQQRHCNTGCHSPTCSVTVPRALCPHPSSSQSL
jgi:hypothetical protein